MREEPASLASSSSFYKELKWTLETIAPLVRFLNEPLVASLQTTRRAHLFEDDEPD
jgi:hypothetical protein